MKYLVLSFFLTFQFVSSFSYSQDEQYSVGTNLGYGLSEYGSKPEFENLRSSFNSSIDIRTLMGPNGIYLRTGIRFFQYGYNYKFHQYLGDCKDYDPSHTDLIETTTGQKTYSFISVPIIGTYKFKRKLKGLTFSMGPHIAFFNHYIDRSSSGMNVSRWQIPLVSIHAYFSAGYETNITEHWILGGELFSNFMINDSFFNCGLSISGRYILKKRGE